MFWKKFYFVVILLSCNCFLLCGNGFCEGVKKFFGCVDQQGNEKKDNFVDNSHVVGLNNNKHEDYNNYINNNNNDLNNEEDDNFGNKVENSNDDNNSDNKVENSNDDNNSDNEGGNSEDNNFGDNSNLNFAFFSNTPCVGKTSILHCLWGIKFHYNYIKTVMTQYIQVTYKNASNNMIKKIFLWDTPGKKEHRLLPTIAFMNAHAIVFVYDITDLNSFNSLGGCIAEVKKQAPKVKLLFLLGNKLDIVEQDKNERQVTREDAQKLAEENGLTFLGECSAKNNTYEPAQKLSYEKVVLQDGKCTGGLSDMLNDIIHYIQVKTKIKVKKNM